MLNLFQHLTHNLEILKQVQNDKNLNKKVNDTKRQNVSPVPLRCLFLF